MKYQVTIHSTVTKLHTVEADSEAQAIAMAGDIFSPLVFGDEGSDTSWQQNVIKVEELE